VCAYQVELEKAPSSRIFITLVPLIKPVGHQAASALGRIRNRRLCFRTAGGGLRVFGADVGTTGKDSSSWAGCYSRISVEEGRMRTKNEREQRMNKGRRRRRRRRRPPRVPEPTDANSAAILPDHVISAFYTRREVWGSG
jgi:hypothetical protein